MNLFLSKLYRGAGLFVCGLLLVARGVHAQVPLRIGQNFTGSTYSVNTQVTPADANGAVGPNHFMEFINGTVAVYNKANGSNVQRKTNLKFWSDAGLIISPDSDVTDPRVIYDPVSQRWFASQVDFDASAAVNGLDPTLEANDFLIAVSTTQNPNGSWIGFMFQADPDTGDFADFPTLGVDARGVYLSGDMLRGEASPIGPGLVSIPKADLIALTPTVTNRTWFGVLGYASRGQVLQPATCFDGSISGVILSMGDIGTDSNPHSNLVSFVVQNPDTAAATLTAPSSIGVIPYVVPFNTDMDVPLFSAVQPDGTQTLQANDARLSAKVYAVGGVLFATHNTEINNHIAIRWYRINAATLAVLETGTLSDPNLDLFFPSIAANSNGVVVIGYNSSGLNENISCWAVAGQTVNGTTTFGSPMLLQSGVASYHDAGEIIAQLQDDPVVDSRWGDYSSLSVDPLDSTRFWSIQMYPSDFDPDFGLGIWSTQITELLTGPPSPLLSIALAGNNVMLSWSNSAAGYQLQSSTNLIAAATWSTLAQTPVTNGVLVSSLVQISGRQQFFRLFHP